MVRKGDCAILSALGESLVLSKSEQGCCLIWVMEQYGAAEFWVNWFKTGMDYGMLPYLQANGMLFYKGVNVYDIESQEIEEVARIYNDHTVFMDTLVETLALLAQDLAYWNRVLGTRVNGFFVMAKFILELHC